MRPNEGTEMSSQSIVDKVRFYDQDRATSTKSRAPTHMRTNDEVFAEITGQSERIEDESRQDGSTPRSGGPFHPGSSSKTKLTSPKSTTAKYYHAYERRTGDDKTGVSVESASERTRVLESIHPTRSLVSKTRDLLPKEISTTQQFSTNVRARDQPVVGETNSISRPQQNIHSLDVTTQSHDNRLKATASPISEPSQEQRGSLSVLRYSEAYEKYPQKADRPSPSMQQGVRVQHRIIPLSRWKSHAGKAQTESKTEEQGLPIQPILKPVPRKEPALNIGNSKALRGLSKPGNDRGPTNYASKKGKVEIDDPNSSSQAQATHDNLRTCHRRSTYEKTEQFHGSSTRSVPSREKSNNERKQDACSHFNLLSDKSATENGVSSPKHSPRGFEKEPFLAAKALARKPTGLPHQLASHGKCVVKNMSPEPDRQQKVTLGGSNSSEKTKSSKKPKDSPLSIFKEFRGELKRNLDAATQISAEEKSGISSSSSSSRSSQSDKELVTIARIAPTLSKCSTCTMDQKERHESSSWTRMQIYQQRRKLYASRDNNSTSSRGTLGDDLPPINEQTAPELAEPKTLDRLLARSNSNTSHVLIATSNSRGTSHSEATVRASNTQKSRAPSSVHFRRGKTSSNTPIAAKSDTASIDSSGKYEENSGATTMSHNKTPGRMPLHKPVMKQNQVDEIRMDTSGLNRSDRDSVRHTNLRYSGVSVDRNKATMFPLQRSAGSGGNEGHKRTTPNKMLKSLNAPKLESEKTRSIPETDGRNTERNQSTADRRGRAAMLDSTEPNKNIKEQGENLYTKYKVFQKNASTRNSSLSRGKANPNNNTPANGTVLPATSSRSLRNKDESTGTRGIRLSPDADMIRSGGSAGAFSKQSLLPSSSRQLKGQLQVSGSINSKPKAQSLLPSSRQLKGKLQVSGRNSKPKVKIPIDLVGGHVSTTQKTERPSNTVTLGRSYERQNRNANPRISPRTSNTENITFQSSRKVIELPPDWSSRIFHHANNTKRRPSPGLLPSPANGMQAAESSFCRTSDQSSTDLAKPYTTSEFEQSNGFGKVAKKLDRTTTNDDAVPSIHALPYKTAKVNDTENSSFRLDEKPSRTQGKESTATTNAKKISGAQQSDCLPGSVVFTKEAGALVGHAELSDQETELPTESLDVARQVHLSIPQNAQHVSIREQSPDSTSSLSDHEEISLHRMNHAVSKEESPGRKTDTGDLKLTSPRHNRPHQLISVFRDDLSLKQRISQQEFLSCATDPMQEPKRTYTPSSTSEACTPSSTSDATFFSEADVDPEACFPADKSRMASFERRISEESSPHQSDAATQRNDSFLEDKSNSRVSAVRSSIERNSPKSPLKHVSSQKPSPEPVSQPTSEPESQPFSEALSQADSQMENQSVPQVKIKAHLQSHCCPQQESPLPMNPQPESPQPEIPQPVSPQRVSREYPPPEIIPSPQQVSREYPQPEIMPSPQPENVPSSCEPSVQPMNMLSGQPDSLSSRQPESLLSRQPESVPSHQPDNLRVTETESFSPTEPESFSSTEPEILPSSQPENAQIICSTSVSAHLRTHHCFEGSTAESSSSPLMDGAESFSHSSAQSTHIQDNPNSEGTSTQRKCSTSLLPTTEARSSLLRTGWHGTTTPPSEAEHVEETKESASEVHDAGKQNHQQSQESQTSTAMSLGQGEEQDLSVLKQHELIDETQQRVESFQVARQVHPSIPQNAQHISSREKSPDSTLSLSDREEISLHRMHRAVNKEESPGRKTDTGDLKLTSPRHNRPPQLISVFRDDLSLKQQISQQEFLSCATDPMQEPKRTYTPSSTSEACTPSSTSDATFFSEADVDPEGCFPAVKSRMASFERRISEESSPHRSDAATQRNDSFLDSPKDKSNSRVSAVRSSIERNSPKSPLKHVSSQKPSPEPVSQPTSKPESQPFSEALSQADPQMENQSVPQVKIKAHLQSHCCPQPESPLPMNPQPMNPQPESPHPESPQPVSLQPASPQPVSPQPVSREYPQREIMPSPQPENVPSSCEPSVQPMNMLSGQPDSLSSRQPESLLSHQPDSVPSRPPDNLRVTETESFSPTEPESFSSTEPEILPSSQPENAQIICSTSVSTRLKSHHCFEGSTAESPSSPLMDGAESFSHSSAPSTHSQDNPNSEGTSTQRKCSTSLLPTSKPRSSLLRTGWHGTTPPLNETEHVEETKESASEVHDAGKQNQQQSQEPQTSTTMSLGQGEEQDLSVLKQHKLINETKRTVEVLTVESDGESKEESYLNNKKTNSSTSRPAPSTRTQRPLPSSSVSIETQPRKNIVEAKGPLDPNPASEGVRRMADALQWGQESYSATAQQVENSAVESALSPKSANSPSSSNIAEYTGSRHSSPVGNDLFGVFETIHAKEEDDVFSGLEEYIRSPAKEKESLSQSIPEVDQLEEGERHSKKDSKKSFANLCKEAISPESISAQISHPPEDESGEQTRL